MRVTISPMIPARTNMIAIARSGVVPHHPPNISFPFGLASQGMTRNCVSGPIMKAVSGEAIFSILWPKPNTLHWRSSGTTFCMIVCSHASAIGERSMNAKNPSPTSHIDETVGNMIQVAHMMRFMRRRVFTGFLPSPYLLTSIPPAINPVLVMASTIHQISTETIESPYASIRDMNTPPMKLLNMAKNIMAKSPEIPAIIRIVPRISISLFLASSFSRCSSRGNVSVRRWRMTRSVTASTIPTAQVMPSCPMTIPENTDTTVNTSPFTAPTCPFARSRSHSGMSIVTSVESAIIRILPTKTPSIDMRMNIQSHGFHISLQVDSGNMRSITKDIE